MNIEEKVEEADHVKTNDETIAPGYLKKDRKSELKEALRSTLQPLVNKNRPRGWQ